MPSPSPSLLDFSQLGPNPARYPPDARAQADYRDNQALLKLGIAPIHHSLTYNGGITSMSHDPVGYRQHVRMPPSATTSSSSPGGSSSGRSTRPLTSLTRQVPQFPAVQLVGISTPASSAISTIGVSGTIRAVPSGLEPRKNRMTGVSSAMDLPQRSSQRVHLPVCLLKTSPAFFIHLLNFVAPAPVAMMNSSRCSCAWM